MQTIYLDISSKGVYPCIEAKQGEVGRKFLAVITDSGLPYQIPQNAMLSVWYSGDNGSGNYSSIGEKSAFSVDGNNICVELVFQMLENPGNGELCLTVTHGDGREISSWNIEYCVEKKPGAGSSIPTDYYSALTEAGAIAAKAVADAQGIVVDAKNAVQTAQKAVEQSAEAINQANNAVQRAENAVLINNTKQNKLSWVTEEDIDAMFAGTYVGIEDEDPEPDVNIKALVSSDGYVLKDSNGLYVKAKEVI
jgi:hypothetical protein